MPVEHILLALKSSDERNGVGRSRQVTASLPGWPGHKEHIIRALQSGDAPHRMVT